MRSELVVLIYDDNNRIVNIVPVEKKTHATTQSEKNNIEFPAYAEIVCFMTDRETPQLLEDANVFVGCSESDGIKTSLNIVIPNKESYNKLLKCCQKNKATLKIL